MRRRLHAHLLTTTMVGAAVLSGSLVGPAAAAPADGCPVPFPTQDAVDGVTGTGLTVERGTTADPFDAVVLGRIDDGIASGVDMIIAELSSPAIDRAGGIWAGMSGSPVYAEDGRLIGAVSYALAGGSPIAGITPAESMLPLLSGSTPAATTTSRTVRPPSALAQDMAGTGEVSLSEAQSGFRLLSLPVRGSVGTGLAAQTGLERMRKGLPSVQLAGGGSVAKAVTADPAEITAGSNFAAALSYGDVTFAGVGTTTFVCDGTAVAFGHPLLDTGDTSLSAHTASAVVVQEDPVWGSFKVANPGGVVGSVTRDARVGIAGPLGVAPATVPVTASFTAPGGAVVEGRSEVVLEDVTPDVAAFQTLGTIEKAYGAASSGTVRFSLTVQVRRADGSIETVRRSDAVSARSSVTQLPVSWLAADEVWFTLYQLLDQDLEIVEIVSVDVTGSTSTAFDTLRVGAVDQRQSRRPSVADNAPAKRRTSATLAPLPSFRPMGDPTVALSGIPLQVRTSTTSLATGAVTRPVFAVPLPVELEGGFATLDVLAGESAYFYGDGERADTFDELLTEIRTRPGRASITVVLTYETVDGDFGQRSWVRRTSAPVSDTYRSFELVVY